MEGTFTKTAEVISKFETFVQSNRFRFMDNEFESLRPSLLQMLCSSRLYATSLKPGINGRPNDFCPLFLSLLSLAKGIVAVVLTACLETDGRDHAWIKVYTKIVDKCHSIEKSFEKAKLELTNGHSLFPAVIAAANTIKPTIQFVEEAQQEANIYYKLCNWHRTIRAFCVCICMLGGAVWLCSFYFGGKNHPVTEPVASSLRFTQSVITDPDFGLSFGINREVVPVPLENGSDFCSVRQTALQLEPDDRSFIAETNASPEKIGSLAKEPVSSEKIVPSTKLLIKNVTVFSSIGLPVAIIGLSIAAFAFAADFFTKYMRQTRRQLDNTSLLLEIDNFIVNMEKVF